MSKNKKRKNTQMTDEQKKQNPEQESAVINPGEVAEEAAKAPEAEQSYEELTLSAEEVKALKEKLDKLQEDRDDAVK